MTDNKIYFKLVLGLVVIVAVGILYHIFDIRNKILEGIDGTTTAAAITSPSVSSSLVPAPTSSAPPSSSSSSSSAPTSSAPPSVSSPPSSSYVPPSSSAPPSSASPSSSSSSSAPSFSSSASAVYTRDRDRSSTSSTRVNIFAENAKATLEISNLLITQTSEETVFYIYIPENLQLTSAGYNGLTIVNTASPTNSVTYKIDDFISMCDSTVVSDLFFSDVTQAMITKNGAGFDTVKRCSNANKLKIISNLNSGTAAQNHSFKIQGFNIPQSSPVRIAIEKESNSTSSGYSTRQYDAFFPDAITQNAVPVPDAFTNATFKIDLSDATPGAKNVTAKYTFKFTPTPANGFVIEKNDSVIHFIFSDDFVLPPVENVKVVINNILLDAGKNEYVLQQKNMCITPSKGSVLFLDSSYKFENENKICMKVYTLFIKQNIPVQSTGLTIALKGLTNPLYSPTPLAYDKKDFLFQAFNTSYSILNLKVKDVGKYLFNPKTDDYVYAGLYMRGNYPVKNKKPIDADKEADADAGDSKMKSSSKSIESRGGSNRAATVYTVNYFYDGQGQGEYGYIARPDIFGTTPYSYGTSRGGLGTSDKYIAKQNRDLAEEKRLHAEKVQQWKESQIRPPMGVAPALLNAGVQPYDATINF
jgi:hypothetical protein